MRVISGGVRRLSRFPAFHSLRVRLTLVVLLASLPALALLFYTASQQRDDALLAGQENADRLVRLAAVDQRRIFDQAEQLLTTIARLPEVQADDSAACAGILVELLAINAEFADLGVVDRDGTPFCSGSADGGADGLDSGAAVLLDSDFIDRTFESEDFTVGTYRSGPSGDDPAITYGVPVPVESGSASRLVYASLDLSALDSFATLARLPEGAVFSVYDRFGVLLSRSPQAPDAIGRSMTDDPAVRAMLDDPAGLALRTLNDPEAIVAGEWIRVVGAPEDVQEVAFITVSLPRDEIVARADGAFEENLSRLGLAALIAVALAWVGADVFMSRDGESRKMLVKNAYRVFETGDLAQLDDIMAADVVDRTPAPGQAGGLLGYKQLVAQFRAAFPNGTVEPTELLADTDKVVARVTLSGQHVAEFYGSPPSGEHVVAHGIETFRFANGVIVEMWSLFGPLTIVELPPPEPKTKPATGRASSRRSMWRRILRRTR